MRLLCAEKERGAKLVEEEATHKYETLVLK